MTIKKLLDELNYYYEKYGDIKITISCGNIKEFIQYNPKEDCIISEEPNFFEISDQENGKELMIRDWPY